MHHKAPKFFSNPKLKAGKELKRSPGKSVFAFQTRDAETERVPENLKVSAQKCNKKTPSRPGHSSLPAIPVRLKHPSMGLFNL